MAWCPSPGLSLLAAASGKRLLLLPSGVGNEEQEAATEAALAACTADSSGSSSGGIEDGQLVSWQRWQGGGAGQGGSGSSGSGSGSGGVVVLHKFGIKHVTWHARGDYFATTAPTGNTQAVLVHQLSKGVTQNPFRKNRGRVVRVLFHPSKPFFFVATQQNVSTALGFRAPKGWAGALQPDLVAGWLPVFLLLSCPHLPPPVSSASFFSFPACLPLRHLLLLLHS